jgi:hypothetical protein
MAMTVDQLPDDPDVLKAMVLARDVENARLTHIVKELQRHRFGRRAESLPEDQWSGPGFAGQAAVGFMH